MKKGLLLVLTVLLIAGLFVSCNSDPAVSDSGSSKDIAYVSFYGSEAKALNTPTIQPATLKDISQYYWFYRATKNAGSVTTGQREDWTIVNTNKGLSATLGPFSVGSWTFELVASTSNIAPSTDSSASNYVAYVDSAWTVEDVNVVYYGRNNNVNLVANETTHVSIDLTKKSSDEDNHVKIVLNGIGIFGSTDSYTSGGSVWYKVTVKDLENPSTGTWEFQVGEISNITGSSTISTPEGVPYTLTPVTNGNALTITIDLYDVNTPTYGPIIKSASKTFAGFSGSTVTITGSLDLLEANAEFDAAVASVTTTSSEVKYYATLEDAINAAVSGETITVLRDLDLTGVYSMEEHEWYQPVVVFDLSGKTLDLGNHNIIWYSDSVQLIGNNYTIKNGTITARTTDQTVSGAWRGYAVHVNDCEASGVTYEGITLDGLTVYGGVRLNRTSGTVKNCTITDENSNVAFYGIYVCDADIAVQDCNISITNYGTAVFYIGAIPSTGTASVTVNGGTYTVGGGKKLCMLSSPTGVYKGTPSLSIEAGVFQGSSNANPTSYVADGSVVEPDTSVDNKWTVSAIE